MARPTTDEKLDEALEQTFPASDPLAVSPEPEPGAEDARHGFPCFFRESDVEAPALFGPRRPR